MATHLQPNTLVGLRVSGFTRFGSWALTWGRSGFLVVLSGLAFTGSGGTGGQDHAEPLARSARSKHRPRSPLTFGG